jgi:N-acyl-D-amino-acid deacylase
MAESQRSAGFDKAETKYVIDAKNQIVAPGFIDVHAHTEDIFDNPTAENFVRMGVTSLITGNCGGSTTDVGEFLGRFKEKPLAVNLGTLIGHNSVRSSAMGLDDRAPTAEEQQKMNTLVDKAMRDGAVGLSTGLIYLPGTFAKPKRWSSWPRSQPGTAGHTQATSATRETKLLLRSKKR